MALSPERLDRFARHIVLPEIGGAGQHALANSHVVLIGVGGIGSPALQYLAGAGIGTLTLIDDDTVEPSNLQRQTLFSDCDAGKRKAELAALWVEEFDPSAEVHWHAHRLSADNAAELVTGADLVLDGCDNFATRLAVSDACVAAQVPLVSAAVGRFQGQVGAFAGHLPGQPCYRCFVGDAFDADDCDTCAEDGVLGGDGRLDRHFRRAPGDPRAARPDRRSRRSAMGQAPRAQRAGTEFKDDDDCEGPGMPGGVGRTAANDPLQTFYRISNLRRWLKERS